MNGKVYLVGAGPGDGGLLTLKGKALIEKADVIVFDRLVGPEIMEMIPDGTETIDVGKNAGRHPVPQNEINEILLSEAKAGKTVVLHSRSFLESQAPSLSLLMVAYPSPIVTTARPCTLSQDMQRQDPSSPSTSTPSSD